MKSSAARNMESIGKFMLRKFRMYSFQVSVSLLTYLSPQLLKRKIRAIEIIVVIIDKIAFTVICFKCLYYTKISKHLYMSLKVNSIIAVSYCSIHLINKQYQIPLFTRCIYIILFTFEFQIIFTKFVSILFLKSTK